MAIVEEDGENAEGEDGESSIKASRRSFRILLEAK